MEENLPAKRSVAAGPQLSQDAGPVASEASSSGGVHKIRVLLADDHGVVRDGLAQLLQKEPDIEVVGQAADGETALELALRLKPDVVVMDVGMPRLNGLEATRRIMSELPFTRVIGLSMHAEIDLAGGMCEAGAVGYLSKSVSPQTLIDTIRGNAYRPAG